MGIKEAFDKEKTKKVLQEMADQDKIGRRGVKAVIDHYDDFMETIGHTGEKKWRLMPQSGPIIKRC